MIDNEKSSRIDSLNSADPLSTACVMAKNKALDPLLAPKTSTAEAAPVVDLGNKENAKMPIGSESIPKPDSVRGDPTEGPQLSPDELDSNLKIYHDFTCDIIDKQYRSYTWSDGKVQALLTIDTALIAGILAVLKIFSNVGTFVFLLLGASFVALIISCILCLIHAIPRIHSGVGNESNLRTIIGIQNLRKEEYHAKVLKLNAKDMIQMNCWQIAGMCKNNMRSHSIIKKGVYLTIFGVLAIGLALSIVVYSDWKHGNSAEMPKSSTNGSAIKIAPPPAPKLQPINPMPKRHPSLTIKKTSSLNGPLKKSSEENQH